MTSPLSILKSVLNLNHNCMHVLNCEKKLVQTNHYRYCVIAFCLEIEGAHGVSPVDAVFNGTLERDTPLPLCFA